MQNSNDALTILFFSDHTFIPHRAGGRESSINDLACDFRNRGWNVFVVVARSSETISRSLESFFPYKVIEVDDIFLSVTAIALYTHADRIVASVDGRNINKFLQWFPAGSCLFVRDVHGLDALVASSSRSFDYVANSKFTALQVEKQIGTPIQVFPPLIAVDLYKTLRTGNYVTFINLVDKKGLRLVLEIAEKLKELDFLLCEGWPLSQSNWEQLEGECKPLGNVVLERYRVDMKTVYSRTKVLLVPSQVEEAWGRVVTEAQSSGIPCIVNNIGGLPESCGEGGITMSMQCDSDAWANVIRSVISNEDGLYTKLSHGALNQTKKYLSRVANYGSTLEHSLAPVGCTRNTNLEGLSVERTIAAFEKRGDRANDWLGLLRTAVEIDKQGFISFRQIAFQIFYRLQQFESAVQLYEEDITFFQHTRAMLLLLANAYAKTRRYQKASNCFDRLFLDPKHKATPFQIKTHANCLHLLGHHESASQWYSMLLEEPELKNDLWSCGYALESFRKAGYVDHYTRLDSSISATSVSNPRAAKLLWTTYARFGEYQKAADLIAEYFSHEGEATSSEYSHAVYVLLKNSNISQALKLSGRAEAKFPSVYKGPAPIERTVEEEPIAFLNARTTNSRTRISSEDIDAVADNRAFVCSWPGMLNGNRYMDELRTAFARQNVGFLPITLPSHGVVLGSEAILVQWPDVLLWRYGTLARDALISIIHRELIALKVWRKSGIRVIWIVHNLVPHDLSGKDRLFWREVFYLFGCVVDEYVSMAPSAQSIIQKAIPSLSLKRFRHFYHPIYNIRAYGPPEIDYWKNSMGLSGAAPITAIMGGIARYKGIPAVIEAFMRVSNSSARLLIVGKCRDSAIESLITRASSSDSRIILMGRFVETDEFDLIANGADQFVVPNVDYLNSGALIYGLSTTKPVLAIRHPFALDMHRAVSYSRNLLLVEDLQDVRVDSFFSQGGERDSSIDITPFAHTNVVNVLLPTLSERNAASNAIHQE